MKLCCRVVVALLLAACLGADWPQLLGPGRDGQSTEKDLVDTFGPKGPPVVWRRDVGEGYASPVVAGGRLVLFHRLGKDDVVECLDAATGKAIWKQSYRTDYEDEYGKGDGPRSTPVIAAGKVVTLGAAGRLSCFDLKTGKALWARELHADYKVRKNFFGVGTSPLIEGDRVLVNVGGEGAGVVALHKDTGKEVWKATDQEASYASPIVATVDGVRHAIFFTRDGLLSLDPATGQERFRKRWRARINASVNAATPLLLGGDHLFLTASYNTGAVLLKVKKDGVQEVWNNDRSLSSHFSTPVAVGGQLYGFDGRQEGGANLRCIDWKDGTVRWTEAGFGCGSIVAAGKKLFLLSEGGELVLAEASPDRLVEKARAKVLGRPVRAHLALSNGLLYGRDGTQLVCWKVKK